MTAPTPVPRTEISRAGVVSPAVTAGDTTNGNSFPNDGSTYITVDNSAGATGTVTVILVQTVDGQTPAAKSYTIPLSSTGYHIGPFPVSAYGNTVKVTASAATLGFRAWRLGQTS